MATLKSIKNKYLQTSDGTTLGVSDNADNVALLAFKMQASDSIAKFNMVDGFSDAYADATGVDASASGSETLTSGYYSGKTAANATGGTITDYTSGGNDYKVHSFLSSATNFVVPNSGSVDLLLVAGGGGAGNRSQGSAGAGGGAGGMRQLASLTLAAGTWVATVGAGGAVNTNGGASTLILSSTTHSASGGGSGNFRPTAVGSTGGSGGGSNYNQPGPGNAGGYSPVEGYPGNWVNDSGYNGGGGGGAGGPGNVNSSTGANGATNNYRTGSNVTYAGGGGGGSGGSGGSGGGGPAGGTSPGTAGSVNTGGGGGSTAYNAGNSAGGGSGIIVIRYVDGSMVSYENMSLISNSATASAQPDTADIVATYTNGAGTASLNVDIKYWVSRNNGSNYTEATMVSQGTSGGHALVSARAIDISGQPAGTTMRYKVTTHNQGSSKETRAQAVSLAWA